MTNTIVLAAGAVEADISRALYSIRDTGGTIVLPPNADITIAGSLMVQMKDADVTIDLNGSTLHQAGTSTVIGVMGVVTPPVGVALGTNGGGNATITYSTLPTNLQVGDWVKVISDDALPNDHIDPGDAGNPTRMGQAAEVIGIEGNTVILRGPLLEQDVYQTNIRASVYPEGQLTIKNGTIDGSSGDFTLGRGGDLIHVRSVVEPIVENVTLRDGIDGVKFVDTVNALAQDVSGTNLWSAVHTSASYGTEINGLFAEHVAHGVLVHGTGSVANAASSAAFGADIGLDASNAVVYDATMAAYDFHSESRNGTYSDALAFDSRMFGDLRGVGNSFVDSAGAGNQYGVQFFEYGVGDGKNSVVQNLVLRETANYSFIVSGTPRNNTVIDSKFESVGSGYNVPDALVHMQNSTITTNVLTVDDLMFGTANADKLLGGKGTDAISGGAGNDYIWGGLGIDLLAGGAGRDRFAYNALNEAGDVITDFQAGKGGDLIDVSVLAIRLGWDRDNLLGDGYIRAIQSGSDTLVQALNGTQWVTLATLLNVNAGTFNQYNLQAYLSDVTGTAHLPAHSDLMQVAMGPEPEFAVNALASAYQDGAVAAIQINALSGGGALLGTAANDGIAGSSAADVVNAGDGNDYVNASEGNDVVMGATGDDLVLGGAGDDALYGNAGDDHLMGEDGNDTLVGGAGQDTLHGGNGDDKLYGNDANDVLHGDVGNDRLYGGAGDDFIYGDAGNDILFGEAGIDLLSGGDGNDSLFGGAGDDVLHSGLGSNTLNGGDGDDIFMFGPGKDFVQDFVSGQDQIGVSGYGTAFDEFSEVMAHAQQRGGNVIITMDGASMTLANVTLASLTASDFIFV